MLSAFHADADADDDIGDPVPSILYPLYPVYPGQSPDSSRPHSCHQYLSNRNVAPTSVSQIQIQI